MDSTIASAGNLQMDFMNLLVTQLKNQNPLEPMDSQDMTAQLAQFSQLQHLENMNVSFSDVLTAVTKDYANSLIGKKVTFYKNDESSGSIERLCGHVDSVFHDPTTKENLLGVTVSEGNSAGEYPVRLDSIVLIENGREN